MRRFFHLVAATLLASGVALGTSTASAAVVIDDFSDAVNAVGGLAPPTGGVSLTSAPASTSTSETGLSGVIGGSRDGAFNLTGTGAASNLTAFVAGGVFSTALNATATGDYSLTYDASGAGLGADFTLASGIEVVISALDSAAAGGAGTSFTIDLVDGDASTHSQTITTTTEGAQTLFFGFGAFSDAGNLDVSNIFSITFSFTPNQAGDVDVELLQTRDQIIPEPASLAVWSLMGLVGYGLRRRSKVARS